MSDKTGYAENTRNKSGRKGTVIALLLLVFLGMAFLSLYMIVSTLLTGVQEQNAFDELTALVA